LTPIPLVKLKGIRISQGSLKGRVIPLPADVHGHNAATPGVVKEAVFQIISNASPRFSRNVFFDLYSGSGQMGMEALSRGFHHVWFLEPEKKRFLQIREILGSLPGEKNSGLLKTKAVEFLSRFPENAPREITGDKTLVFFADPPYSFAEKNPEHYAQLMDGLLAITSALPAQPALMILQIPYKKKEYAGAAEFLAGFDGKIYSYGKNALAVKISTG